LAFDDGGGLVPILVLVLVLVFTPGVVFTQGILGLFHDRILRLERVVELPTVDDVGTELNDGSLGFGMILGVSGTLILGVGLNVGVGVGRSRSAEEVGGLLGSVDEVRSRRHRQDGEEDNVGHPDLHSALRLVGWMGIGREKVLFWMQHASTQFDWKGYFVLSSSVVEVKPVSFLLCVIFCCGGNESNRIEPDGIVPISAIRRDVGDRSVGRSINQSTRGDARGPPSSSSARADVCMCYPPRKNGTNS